MILREGDRERVKGLTVRQLYRKVGIARTPKYRPRQQYAPNEVHRDAGVASRKSI
jgi:hypothetical protein